MKRILVTGASGFLGQRLAQRLSANPHYEVFSTYCQHRPQTGQPIPLDLRHPAAAAKTLQNVNPHAVIHTAYTKIEKDMPAVIAEGTAFLAELFTKTRFIHISTDYVFDGFHGPYCEQDTPQPHTPYGKAKYAAELLVKRHCRNYAVIRTSLISGDTPLPPRWISEQAKLRQGEPICFFRNEIRNPIHVDDLAAAILAVMESDYQGPLHIAGPQWLSRYEELELFVKWQGLPISLISSTLSNGINRPLNCSLNISRFMRIFNLPLREPKQYWPAKA